jgi:glycosyltransferase involved in cell wall biosynthesis
MVSPLPPAADRVPTSPRSGKRPRVAWVAVEPTPYHMPLFERIQHDGRIEIEYFFCTKQATQPWTLEPYAELMSSASHARRFSCGGLYFNPAIVAALLRRHWDAVVLSGYAHWTMRLGLLVCLVRRIPFILQSDTHLLRPRHWWRRAVKRCLLFPLLRRAAAGIGLGRLQQQYFESIGIPAARLFTVPLTPHLDRFRLPDAERAARRAALRHEWAIPESTVVGVFVGRLVAVKALDLLLTALDGLPLELRPTLLLVGDGPERGPLEALVERHRLPVRFLGFSPNDDLPALLAASDFFVLPSHQEAWGIVVAEAMAAGLPVLLSDQVGAAYDLLQIGHNGYRFPAGSAAALGDALARCVRERSRLSEMGQHSREIIADWNCETSAREFFRAVDVALGRG